MRQRLDDLAHDAGGVDHRLFDRDAVGAAEFSTMRRWNGPGSTSISRASLALPDPGCVARRAGAAGAGSVPDTAA
jgi:hypothetical protein